jgi:hypothetical protein
MQLPLMPDTVKNNSAKTVQFLDRMVWSGTWKTNIIP